jgi:hypothetical protein
MTSTTSVRFLNCNDLYMTSIHSACVHHLFVISFCGFSCMSTKLIPITTCLLNRKFVSYWQCHLLRLYGVCAKWMSEFGMLVEWYWERRTKVLRAESSAVLLCPPQILHGLAWVWTWTPTVRGWWLAAWAMAGPMSYVKGTESTISSADVHITKPLNLIRCNSHLKDFKFEM